MADNNNMIPVRVWFLKQGRAKYISHLDLVRAMSRAIKRAQIPVWYTEGFHPHMYLTFAQPLSLGQESRCEIVQFRLLRDMPMAEICSRLNHAFPEGLLAAKAALPVKDFAAIDSADYTVTLHDVLNPTMLTAHLRAFLGQAEIITQKKSKKGIKDVDIRPMVRQFVVETHGPSGVKISLRLSCGGRQNLNPSLLLDAFEKATGQTWGQTGILRTAFYDTSGNFFE